MPVEMDRSDQARLVPTDIENRQSADDIHRGEIGLEFIERIEIIIFYNPVPCLEGTAAVRMILCKFLDQFPRNNMHGPICIAI
jgi:hypothetical protein